MKTLTATQKKLLERRRLTPVILVDIALQNSGPTLYLSDRQITVSGVVYEKYIKNVKSIDEDLSRITSESMNSDVTILFDNQQFRSFSHLAAIGSTYPFEGSITTIKELYLDDDNSQSEVLTIFKGALDEPKNVNLIDFQCSVSSLPYYNDSLWNREG